MLRIFSFLFTILIVFVLVVPSSAQTSEGSVEYEPPSSNPTNLTLTEVGVFFTADDGVHDRELWLLREPTGIPEMITNMTNVSMGDTFEDFMPFGKGVTFRAGTEGQHTMWYSDGSVEGTSVIEFDSNAKSYRYPMFEWDGRFFYVCEDFQSTNSIWYLEADTFTPTPLIQSDDRGYQLIITSRSFALMDDYFMFSASTNINGASPTYGLWRSDGTDQGTYVVKEFIESPVVFFRFDDMMFFQALSSEKTGWELWKTDGTSEGTVMVKDIAPGHESSSPGDLHRIEGDDGIYFAALDQKHGRELWFSDGTEEGTYLVADIFPGSSDAAPYKFISNGQFLFFNASSEGTGAELWRTTEDGKGVELVKDIYPGPEASEPYAFSLHEKTLIFSANSPEVGEELWATDGTNGEGAILIADVFTGAESSYPYHTTYFKGHTIFTADHPLIGNELWRMETIGQDVVPVFDIHDDELENPSSSPDELTVTTHQLFFTADNVKDGTELWVSDGSKEGTVMVKDIFPGRASSDPQEITALNQVKVNTDHPLNRVVYFRADDGSNGVELWKSDGTNEGTKMVKDIWEGNASSAPREFTPWNTHMFFVATDNVMGTELWIARSDSVVVRVHDICPGLQGSNPHSLVVWNEKLYFRADDGVNGEELWVSDGYSKGTVMLKDIVEIPVESSSLEIVPFKDGLYFAQNDGKRGEELWKLSDDGKTISLFKDIARN